MSDYSLRSEAEAVLSDLARAKGRLDLILASLPGREVSADLCSRLIAITSEARLTAGRTQKKAEALHRAAQRQSALTYGYVAHGGDDS